MDTTSGTREFSTGQMEEIPQQRSFPGAAVVSSEVGAECAGFGVATWLEKCRALSTRLVMRGRDAGCMT